MRLFLLALFVWVFNTFLFAQKNQQLGTSIMKFGDTTRIGKPFSKDPYVIKFKGQYFIYYSVPPYQNNPKSVNGWGIGIAASKDFVEWKKVGEINPSADYENKGICAPSVLVIKNIVHLFYQTYGNGAKDAICHAVSTDGLNFIRDASNPIFRPTGKWTCGRAIDAEVVKFKHQYLLYFATRDSAFQIQYLGVASTPLSTSFKRHEWTQRTDYPIIKPELFWEGKCVEAASTIKRRKKLFLFYAGSFNNTPQQIGVAVSNNGIEWKRIFEKPFLENGKKGEWNYCESGHPHIFKNDDGRTWLFFQGNNDNGKTWFISKVEILWEKDTPYLSW